MPTGSVVSRVAAPTGVTAGVTTILAVAVNLATNNAHSVWLWVAVVVLTVSSFGASMWLHRRQSQGDGPVLPGGVDLSDVHGAALKIDTVRSPGTGVKVEKGKFGGDIDIRDVTAGGEPSPDPS